MNMVINCVGYEDGYHAADLTLDEIATWPRAANRFIWLGLYEPTEDLLKQVQKAFDLHDLAIEDAHTAHQRPKLEVYGNSLFLVLNTAQRKEGKVYFGETHIFVGKGYVVTVRHGSTISHKDVRTRCESNPDMLVKGEDFVLYALLDFIVDNYFPIVHEIEQEVEALEHQIFDSPFDRNVIESIYDLKRNLLSLRKMISPVIEICNRLIRFEVSFIHKNVKPYFGDVQDHAMSINETIDSLREMLSSAMDANLQLTSVHQSEVTKRLASWAAILAIPTAIAGIYGMNFDYIPELHWRYGYLFSLCIIGGVMSYLYRLFKKSGWL